MEIQERTKPDCELVGTDGNVFSIINKVSKVLKRAGDRDSADEFTAEAFECESYDEVLRLLYDYVNPT